MNKSLNTYRFFAFLAVFLFHTDYMVIGYLGVPAFFVLSGFLITPILLQTKEKQANLQSYLKNFWGRRALRILPAFYAYHIAALIIIFCFNLAHMPQVQKFLDQMPWSLTYTYNFFHASDMYQYSRYVTHFWSLAVEEQFYLFYPFVIFFIPARKLKLLFILTIIFGPVIRYTTYLISVYHLLPHLNLSSFAVIYASPSSYADAFAIGGLASIIAKPGIISSKTALILFVFLYGGTFLMHLIFNTEWTWTTMGFNLFMKNNFSFVWAYSYFNILFAVVLLLAKHRTFLPTIFENKHLSYLGKISYGLYLFHLPVIQLFYNIYGQTLLSALFSFGATVLISIASYELFESYFLSLKERWFKKVTEASF